VINKLAKKYLDKRIQAIYEPVMRGAGDDKTPADFDADKLKEATEFELQFFYDPDEAQEIALNHMAVDPAYYDKLKKCQISASYFVDTLRRIVGSKKYLEDVAQILSKLSNEQLEIFNTLSTDLLTATIDNSRNSYSHWDGGFGGGRGSRGRPKGGF